MTESFILEKIRGGKQKLNGKNTGWMKKSIIPAVNLPLKALM